MKMEEFQNLHLQLSIDDINRIDAWKVDNGMRSRVEAIRSMIKAASQINLEYTKSSSMRERNDYGFLGSELKMHDKYTKKEPSLEEMVRKLVKDELTRNNKKKK